MTISATSARKSKQAFTLVELLLVVVLLGVLAGVVFPRLKGSVRAAGLDESAQRLAGLIRFARAESVRRGLKIRLTIDTARSSCTLALQNADSSGIEDYCAFEDPLLDEEHMLPQGVRFGQIRQNEQVVRSSVIYFTPDGVSDPYAIELVDQSGRNFVVEIGPWVDQVTVTRQQEGVL